MNEVFELVGRVVRAWRNDGPRYVLGKVWARSRCFLFGHADQATLHLIAPDHLAWTCQRCGRVSTAGDEP